MKCTMEIDLDKYEISLIKIALSQWHCLVTLEAIKTDSATLHDASEDIYNLLRKIEGL